GAAGTHRTDRVVLLTLFGVTQDGVGLAHLFEALFSRRVPGIAIRVKVARELAVGLLNVRLRGTLRHAEDRVEVLTEPILAGHGHLLSHAQCGISPRAGRR